MTTVRTDRLREIADRIIEFPGHFNMEHWCRADDAQDLTEMRLAEFVHYCGSAACIGGWSEVLWGHKTTGFEADKILGLTDAQAGSLFYRHIDHLKTDEELAARYLRHLADALDAGAEWKPASDLESVPGSIISVDDLLDTCLDKARRQDRVAVVVLEPEECEAIRAATERLTGQPVAMGPLPDYVLDAMARDAVTAG